MIGHHLLRYSADPGPPDAHPAREPIMATFLIICAFLIIISAI